MNQAISINKQSFLAKPKPSVFHFGEGLILGAAMVTFIFGTYFQPHFIEMFKSLNRPMPAWFWNILSITHFLKSPLCLLLVLSYIGLRRVLVKRLTRRAD